MPILPSAGKISSAKTPMKTVAYTYATYKFMQILVTDWKDQDAYQYGIIDDEGNTIRSYSDLTTIDEKNSFTLFHRLVFNIKRIMQRVPFVKSKLGTLATALFLIRENKELTDVLPLLEEAYPKFFQSMLEESSTTYQFSLLRAGLYCLREDIMDSTGDIIPEGSIIEVTEDQFNKETFMGYKIFVLDDGERKIALTQDILESENSMSTTSGVSIDQPVGRNALGDIKRRHTFAGCDVFDVSRDVWVKCMKGKPKFHKYANYVGGDDVGEEIRTYARSNPKRRIILRDDKTGSMIYLRR